MSAKIVVGLGWGDEGKGITTDFLVSHYPNSIVVRYNGGHQAAHNVVIGDKSHIHSSYGAGTLRGAPSYISEYCCFYPPNMQREYDVLVQKGITPVLYIHPLAKLTTPYDVAFNRTRERKLGHGSCGLGIGATFLRNEGPYKLHAVDMSNSDVLHQKLDGIRKLYEEKLLEFSFEEVEYYRDTVSIEIKFFYDGIYSMVRRMRPHFLRGYDILKEYDTVIFEGAQGVMLDMDFGTFPNVTYSYTTSRNAIEICEKLGIDAEIYYVTRCYQTRHGSGWMSGNDPVQLKNNEREINVTNEWQGSLRTAELDYSILNFAIACDSIYSGTRKKHLIITCLDQRPDFRLMEHMIGGNISSFIKSYSPDCKDFKFNINPYHKK